MNCFKTLLTVICLFILTSCGKDEYEPISTSTEACQINVICVDRTGKDLLENKEFVDGITVEGDASHSKIKFSIKNTGSNKSICFLAELPDQNDMNWSKDRTEATGSSKMTMRFGKHKVELRCYIKYVPNRPPAVSGGKATLEEVTCNKQTFKRSGSSVTVMLRMDENGKLL